MDLAGTVKDKVEADGLFKNKAILLPNSPSNGWKPNSGEVPPRLPELRGCLQVRQGEDHQGLR